MVASRLLISAAHKSSGKTTVSVGLCAALRARGLAVQPFKKGPDFIDPMWLAAAAGRACRNLDPYLSTPESLRDDFVRHGRDAQVCVVEGNKGLHDGVSVDGRDSSAGLARILGLPVVLVLDARGTIRGVAPLLLGYQAFDPAVRIVGVILNRVGGARHEGKLRQVIEHYTDVPVLGALHEDASVLIAERHLGLVPSNEAREAVERIDALARFVAAGVDLERLLAVTQVPQPAGVAEPHRAPRPASVAAPDSGSVVESLAVPPTASPAPAPRVRIAIARNEAFGFYYPEDLEAFAAAGAELVPFDPLRDRALPPVDGLFVGGGFPEMFGSGLQANRPLRAALRSAIAAGLPTYAECGGLMYLARSIRWGSATAQMVGAIPGDVVMHERPVGRGYVHLEETDDAPWPGRWPGTIKAHEFHYSSLENLPPDARYAYRVTRGHGIDGRRDGLVIGNLLACYTHLRSLPGRDWPARFVAQVQQVAASRTGGPVARPTTSTAVSDHG
jgi:cobyrinic acid a,c-diamide synthase